MVIILHLFTAIFWEFIVHKSSTNNSTDNNSTISQMGPVWEWAGTVHRRGEFSFFHGGDNLGGTNSNYMQRILYRSHSCPANVKFCIFWVRFSAYFLRKSGWRGQGKTFCTAQGLYCTFWLPELLTAQWCWSRMNLTVFNKITGNVEMLVWTQLEILN